MSTLLLVALLAGPVQDAGEHKDDPELAAWHRANAAHRLGELRNDEKSMRDAEEGYRNILRDWPGGKYRDMTIECLGDVLLDLKRPSEAREALKQLTEADARATAWGQAPFRPELFVKIGKTHEAEWDWARALEAYKEGAKQGSSEIGGCGTCMVRMALASQTRMARCLYRLGRNDEAMAICRQVLFEADGMSEGLSTELSIIAVDAAVAAGRLEYLEHDLLTLPRPRIEGGHAEAALKYVAMLRLRVARDIEGLFRVLIDPSNSHFGWQNQYRWAELKAGGRLAIEAAECLAELGDPAFNWLESQAQGEGSWQTWATIALAHFHTDRARAIVHNPPSLPRSNGPQFVQMLEQIQSGTPRTRPYPRPRFQRQSVDKIMLAILASLLVLGLAVGVARRKKQGDF